MKANKNQVNRLLKTAKGQIDGMLKMIEEDKYCIEISTQILATIAILKRVNIDILDAHLHHCVMNANSNEDKETKMDEISFILKKAIKG